MLSKIWTQIIIYKRDPLLHGLNANVDILGS